MVESADAAIAAADQHAVGGGIKGGAQIGQQGFQLVLVVSLLAAVQHAEHQPAGRPARGAGNALHALLDRPQRAIVAQHLRQRLRAGAPLACVLPQAQVLRRGGQCLHLHAMHGLVVVTRELGGRTVGKADAQGLFIDQPHGFQQCIERLVPEGFKRLVHGTPGSTARSKK
ncbi:hypothetical protein D3C86_1623440 [compost metagenome]